MMKTNTMKKRNIVAYVKKSFGVIKRIKVNMMSIKKYEMTVFIQAISGGLLITFVI